MLHELDVLEAKQIADLASERARCVTGCWRRCRMRSWASLCPREANTTQAVLPALNSVLAAEPEFVALRRGDHGAAPRHPGKAMGGGEGRPWRHRDPWLGRGPRRDIGTE